MKCRQNEERETQALKICGRVNAMLCVWELTGMTRNQIVKFPTGDEDDICWTRDSIKVI